MAAFPFWGSKQIPVRSPQRPFLLIIPADKLRELPRERGAANGSEGRPFPDGRPRVRAARGGEPIPCRHCRSRASVVHEPRDRNGDGERPPFLRVEPRGVPQQRPQSEHRTPDQGELPIPIARITGTCPERPRKQGNNQPPFPHIHRLVAL